MATLVANSKNPIFPGKNVESWTQGIPLRRSRGPIVTQKNAAKLLSNFIASQLRTKRENLNFIVAQKISKIEGIVTTDQLSVR